MNGEIIVTEADAAFLRMGRLTAPLQRELQRARIVPSEAVPPDVATMNSQVCYTDETRRVTRVVALVYERAPRGSRMVSVRDPVGSALLGLSAGQRIDWRFPDGTHRRLRLDAVIHQPERSRASAAKAVLMAVPPAVRGRFERALHGHKLHWASTVPQARQMLAGRPMDLVILCYRFDESRALELLWDLRSDDRVRRTAVLCLIALKSRLPAACFEAFQRAAMALHATGVEDVRDLPDDANGDRRLRELAAGCLARREVSAPGAVRVSARPAPSRCAAGLPAPAP